VEILSVYNKNMLEVGIIAAGSAGIAMIISVLFYNMRRSRCVKCKGCGCEIERENMSAESMKEDKLQMPSVL
jgi:hypothetical protein